MLPRLRPRDADESIRDDRYAENGFLYIEILIAMFILAMALLSVVPLFVSASHENGAARDLMLATAAAQDKAEELKTLAYDELIAGADAFTQGTVSYQRAWVVQADSPYTGMATVTVTVNSDRSNTLGGSRSASVTFYRYD